jgi:hypothetical protein
MAYFEGCFDAVFGVVYRPEFEARLRAHFEGNVPRDDDPAWYALRNTVYTSGCRQFLANTHSTTFVDAQAQAWRYFENALDVHTELLYSPTGLLAVQALAAMVCIFITSLRALLISVTLLRLSLSRDLQTQLSSIRCAQIPRG